METNLTDDEKSDELGQSRVSRALPGDNIPFFRSHYQHLGLSYLLFSQLHVSRQLTHLDAKSLQLFTEGLGHLSCEGFHGRYVHNLRI